MTDRLLSAFGEIGPEEERCVQLDLNKREIMPRISSWKEYSETQPLIRVVPRHAPDNFYIFTGTNRSYHGSIRMWPKILISFLTCLDVLKGRTSSGCVHFYAPGPK